MRGSPAAGRLLDFIACMFCTRRSLGWLAQNLVLYRGQTPVVGLHTSPAGAAAYRGLTPVLYAIALSVLTRSRRRAGSAHAAPRLRVARMSWSWSWDAKVFAGFNYQCREFTDFHEVESQNWLMGAGTRPAGDGRVGVNAMLSFEPFTVQALGSPQVFQTGETYRAGAAHRLPASARPVHVARRHATSAPSEARERSSRIDAVGSPAIGPPVFMHRPVGRGKPVVVPVAPHAGFDAHHAGRRHGRR